MPLPPRSYIGTTGGVEAMASFQQKFFPDVYARSEAPPSGESDPYCVYNDVYLQLFSSSLFLAGMFITLPASYVCRRYGRKPVMQAAGVFFLAGSILNALAPALWALVVCRILFGFGIGCGNQVGPPVPL